VCPSTVRFRLHENWNFCRLLGGDVRTPPAEDCQSIRLFLALLSYLERSATQQNAIECNAANQYDKDRHSKRKGPDVPFPGGSKLI
jgi:hypothetical protein